MLVFSSVLHNKPVGSIQAGHRVGTIQRIIIDPHQLKVVAFGIDSAVDKNERILFTEDIISFSLNGLIIQTNDELMEPDGLVRFNEIEDLQFSITGKPVLESNGSKVGVATSFVYDSEGFFIQKIHCKSTGMKAVKNGERIIGRSQIESVTDTAIVIKAGTERVSGGALSSLKRTFLGGQKVPTQASSSSISE